MDVQLIFAVIAGISVLLFLILKLKIHAFIALLIACITVGIATGLPVESVYKSIANGVGSTLGFVAVVVGLGALFGGLLEASGGAQALASFILKKTGEKNAPTALVVTGFIISIPVFFDVAFIILLPIIFALTEKSKKPLLYFAIPLLAGLVVTHSFIPPTPGPVAVAEILNAPLGWVIMLGALVGLPTAIISGPIFGNYIAKKIPIGVLPAIEQLSESKKTKVSAVSILLIILLPIALIVLNTLTNDLQWQNPILQLAHKVIKVIGHPFGSLILANLLAWYYLGVKKNKSKKELLSVASKSLEPAGAIILLTGAGGAFKQILVDTNIGGLIANTLLDSGLHPLVFAFVVAAIIRLLQGSATTAMVAAAGIVYPLLQNTAFSSAQLALFVIAIASGSSIFSHVNDSGFWLVGQYLGLSEKQTFRSWTMMTTIIAFLGLAGCLLLWLVF